MTDRPLSGTPDWPLGWLEQSADAWAAAQSCNLLVWMHTRRCEFAAARDFSDRDAFTAADGMVDCNGNALFRAQHQEFP